MLTLFILETNLQVVFILEKERGVNFSDEISTFLTWAMVFLLLLRHWIAWNATAFLAIPDNCRDHDLKSCAFSKDAVDGDSPSHFLDYLLADAQSKASPSQIITLVLLQSAEIQEQVI